MKLRGQHGYAMAALLVALSVLAILLTAAMPTWRQMVRREKEAELVFRGEQYARAIGLFQQKAGPGVLPTDLDVLIDQKYLRKKYKDPITGEDFDLLRLTPNSSAPGQPGGPGGAQPGPPAGSQGRLGAGVGGIQGVVSKSKDESIRLYNGRTHYNEWQFVFVPQTQAAGGPAGAGGQGGPGRSGGPEGPATQGGQGPQGGSGGFGTGGRGGNGGGRAGQPPPGRSGPFGPAGQGGGFGGGRGR